MRDARLLGAAGALLALYLAAFALLPPGVFYSPDEGAKYLQLRSLGWDGGFTYTVRYGGAALDPQHAFYPTHCRNLDLYPVRLADGSVRLHWPIWFSLATWLPYQLFGLRGLYVVPLVAGWLVALCSGVLARRFDHRLAPLAVLAVGVATPLAFFSQTYWEHTLATLCAVAALTRAAAGERRPLAAWLAVPLLLAAVVLRIELVPFAVAMALAWPIARRGAAAAGRPPATRRWLVAQVLTVLAVLAVAAAFLPFRHRWVLERLPIFARGTLAMLPELPATLLAMLVDVAGNRSPVLPAWWRPTAAGAFALALAAPFLRPPRLATAVGLAASAATLALCMILAWSPRPYMSLHGLVPVAPFLVLATWAVPAAWRSGRFDQRLVVATAALYLPLAAAVLFIFTAVPGGAYRTGLEWGNRYLLVLYPLATVLALAGVQAWRAATDGGVRRLVAVLAAALLWCGVQMEWRGQVVLHGSRTLLAEWQAAAGRDVPLVTDIWWLPAALAPYFADQPMFCVRDGDDLAAWIATARRGGAAGFTLASFRDLAPPASGDTAAATPEASRVAATGLRLTRYRLAGPGG